MNKQPEALRLADWCDAHSSGIYRPASEAAAELRRLHAENQALNDALQYSIGCHQEMSELAVRQRLRLDELEPQGEQKPVAWYVERQAPGRRDHGMKLGPFWKRKDAEEWLDDNHRLRSLYAGQPPQARATVRRHQR